ncbi:hypothetical protein LJC34_07290 [Oscillospiraceae bacterium OttesenSCG-928-G22]|nr:hypothetical protein [Oscillospiraceae bacterium OttesenSCG-928-G22]
MPETLYRCTKCGKEHPTYDEADRCEKAHLSASEVVKELYRIGPYPYLVSLRFPDGREMEFMVRE